MGKFLTAIGLAPNERDRRLSKLVSNSYQSATVVGRGTLRIDPQEVRDSQEFRHAQEQARSVVGC